MFVVRFRTEDGEEIAVPAREGENLLAISKRAGIPIWAPCSGFGSCGKCRVQILAGTLISPPSFYIDDVDYQQGWRLACTSKICGDVTVLVD